MKFVLALLGVGAFACGPTPTPTPTPAPTPTPTPTPTPAPTPAPALTADAGVLACPILEVVGEDEPNGWLGAAAAHLACDRATVMLGGLTSRTLVPAELLDLPRAPADDFPDDPFAAADARARSAAAARVRSAAWLEGRVEVTRDGFNVLLRVVTAASSSEPSTGHAPELYQAVIAALDGLVGAKALPAVTKIAPEVASWTLIPDVDLALMLFDWDISRDVGVGSPELLARLATQRARLGVRWTAIEWFAYIDGLGAPRPTDAVVPDLSTPANRMWTTVARALSEKDVDAKALAAELARARGETKDARGRIALIGAEATVRQRSGDSEAARNLQLAVFGTDPRAVDWVLLSDVSMARPSYGPIARASSAWLPSRPNSWHSPGYAEGMSVARKMELFRRATVIAPHTPVWNFIYAEDLLASAQPMRARSIAARLSLGGPSAALSAAAIEAECDLAEGKFSAAFERALPALLQVEIYGNIMGPDRPLHQAAGVASEILHDGARLADAFAQRFVLAEPPRLAPSRIVLTMVAGTCVRATQAIASQCFAKLRALQRAGYFVEGEMAATEDYLTAAERFVAGDLAGTAKAYQSLLAFPWPASFAIEAYDAIGDHETASQLDAKVMSWAPATHGATVAHAREAHRACAKKDFARCRTLAQTVIDAWSLADAKIPAVDDMRALLATLTVP